MGGIEGKLAKMGLRLPPVHPYPSPNRIPCVQVGSVIFLGGHSTARHPLMLGAKNTGKVGSEITEQEAYVAARAVALQILASQGPDRRPRSREARDPPARLSPFDGGESSNALE